MICRGEACLTDFDAVFVILSLAAGFQQGWQRAGNCPYAIACWYSDKSMTVSDSLLTHWGWVTHICMTKLTIIGSENGLSPSMSPGRCQPIIWTNVGILLIGSLGTNFREISIGIQIFLLKKMPLKMSFAKWHPFCLGLNVLILWS